MSDYNMFRGMLVHRNVCVLILSSMQGKSSGQKHRQPKPTSSAPHASGQDVTHGPSSSRTSQLARRQTEPLRNLPNEAELSETLRSTHLDQGAEPSGATISPQKVKSTGDRKGRAVAGGSHLLESEQLHVVTNDKPTMPGQEKGTKLRKEEIVAPKKVKGSVAQAQLRATFYPKFENEKSDQEVNFSCLLLEYWMCIDDSYREVTDRCTRPIIGQVVLAQLKELPIYSFGGPAKDLMKTRH